MVQLKRHISIFFLQFQEVIEDRGRIFVWTLLAMISPLVYMLFWRGTKGVAGWSVDEIISYYLLAIVMYAAVMSHQEEHIATIDIQEGGLTAYLLKPFPYVRFLFFNEASYRVLQGLLGVFMLACFAFLFPGIFIFTNHVDIFLLSVLSMFFAFLITFVFKTAIGLLAFWMTEMRGIFEPINFVLIVFAGLLMPLAFLPHWLESIAYLTPFAYMIYFPVLAFEGKLTMLQLLSVLGMQLVWISILFCLYKILWRAGLKQYTAVGQ